MICPTLISGVPSNIRLADVRKDLTSIDYVISVHKVHVWSLTAGKTVLSAHMVIGMFMSFPYVIVFMSFSSLYPLNRINFSTVQYSLYSNSHITFLC